MKITDILTRNDIDLIDKLDNMCDSEISGVVYDICSGKFFNQIEDEVWNLMCNHPVFSDPDFYDGLAREYDARYYRDLKAAELYNCDLLYMTAIAIVLGLDIPEDAGDVEIFGVID